MAESRLSCMGMYSYNCVCIHRCCFEVRVFGQAERLWPSRLAGVLTLWDCGVGSVEWSVPGAVWSGIPCRCVRLHWRTLAESQVTKHQLPRKGSYTSQSTARVNPYPTLKIPPICKNWNCGNCSWTTRDEYATRCGSRSAITLMYVLKQTTHE